ncbi:MAG: AmmeMemoRadiSam system protein B [Candidatus Riflemargulisbacteria bacterium]
MSLLKNSFAGSFYANNPVILKKQLEGYLANTTKTISAPKAIIVPHAGYIYSAKVAAYGYKQLEKENIKTAIILGPAHKTFHQGLAIPIETELQTPLGILNVDANKISQLLSSNAFILDSKPHYQEHSLEVQFPFIKMLLPECKIIPISVGMIDNVLMAKGAKALAGIIDENTILIVSNDLSHYHSLKTANLLDENTITHILNMSADNLLNKYQAKEIECCGVFPIALLLSTLNKLKILRASVLNYDTSASTSFDDEHVVGYASIAFY